MINRFDKLDKSFYLNGTVTVAKELLGKYLVRVINGERIVGMITETEAYIGAIDKACHAYGGKRTARTDVMYSTGGIAYVYMIYGMYYCLNVVTEREGEACAVLIRGLRIVENISTAYRLRYGVEMPDGLNDTAKGKQMLANLSNGPGKLCRCMAIDKELNAEDFAGCKLYIAQAAEGYLTESYTKAEPEFRIGELKRIGVDYAEEAKDFLWRFLLHT